ncbi:MAG: U32 family peptidase [Candidatus Cloacimonetes bacterium]|nr:U32 family peptidase [Candidatus Cloacimonadota bacterium]
MEVLAPAGDWDKLKYAVAYGADAVYTAGKQFGLRAKAGNLDNQQIKEAAEFCHSYNRRIYVTVNIFAHNNDLTELPAYINYLNEVGVDALIVSDPGVLSIVRETAPRLPIHLSTQANTTSWKAAEFWAKQGVKRIILARELTFQEIKEIIKALPQLEFEIFVHGAMCISYSGRCLLSAFLNNRSANKGLCTQPCRWKFTLLEETRPDQYFPIEEDDRGTYILNSRDLCLYEHLHEILDSGINSIKIEGRMKSLYYVANTTRVYKTALKLLKSGEKSSHILSEELEKISHRQYTTGFFTGSSSLNTQYYESSSYIRDYQYLGEILETKKQDSNRPKNPDNQEPEIGLKPFISLINVKAKFRRGEEIEIIFPDYRQDMIFKVDEIYSSEDELLVETKPNSIVKLMTNEELPNDGILRKKIT